ncbi:MAG: hypothetical protein ACREEM_39305, partial [Blastocatellia bacterium]
LENACLPLFSLMHWPLEEQIAYSASETDMERNQIVLRRMNDWAAQIETHTSAKASLTFRTFFSTLFSFTQKQSGGHSAELIARRLQRPPLVPAAQAWFSSINYRGSDSCIDHALAPFVIARFAEAKRSINTIRRSNRKAEVRQWKSTSIVTSSTTLAA